MKVDWFVVCLFLYGAEVIQPDDKCPSIANEQVCAFPQGVSTRACGCFLRKKNSSAFGCVSYYQPPIRHNDDECARLALRADAWYVWICLNRIFPHPRSHIIALCIYKSLDMRHRVLECWSPCVGVQMLIHLPYKKCRKSCFLRNAANNCHLVARRHCQSMTYWIGTEERANRPFVKDSLRTKSLNGDVYSDQVIPTSPGFCGLAKDALHFFYIFNNRLTCTAADEEPGTVISLFTW
jgi:hypothetical protein